VSYFFSLANPDDNRVPRKIISGAAFLLLLDALKELLLPGEILTEYFTSNRVLHKDYFQCLYLSFEDVATKGKGSGGIIGRTIGDVLTSIFGKGGAAVMLFGLLLLAAYIFHGLELMASLRRRNAYQQEMEDAYDRFVEEEDYTEPSYRVIPASHRKAKQVSLDRKGNFQAVDLKAAGEKLDEMEAKEQKERSLDKKEKERLKQQTKKKKKEQEKAAKAWEEAKPDNQSAGKDLTVPTDMQNVSTDTPAVPAGMQEIPIYREEMNQKFGNATPQTESAEIKTAEKPMDSFAHKEEVTDVRPTSQLLGEQEQNAAAVRETVPKKEPAAKKSAHGKIGGEDYVSHSDTFNALNESKVSGETIPYQFPPIDLLGLPTQKKGTVSDETLRDTAMRLKETLASFNVEVEMGAVTCGPTVTRYEVLPAQGVRVNKITNLADDLKLSLAAPSIRIEAPIPGKSAVGIEVPNESPSAVHFRELLDGKDFEKAKSPVSFAVGKDIAGKVVISDIAKMPHLLIAGATGSGKSVCINTLIMSILYKADPNEVKLIMIDPKVVELSCYNGIPHLFCPVVTDPKEAAASLNWAVREMMDRYNKFKELGVRNIAGYNDKLKTVENAEEAGYSHMPLLVIIVDEFADLMMVASKEVEDAVCRLAQLARAAGIHLILATQRPSVNVITGVIKANIPSRIAFSVSSAIDSRTILDKAGAEKLLGKGDMLFFPSGYSEPVRLQGAFVSDKEVADVVSFLCDNNETPVYNEKVTEVVETPFESGDGGEEKKSDVDEYFEDAGRFVIDSGRAAAGQLQRRFSIGFNRAGRIIDQLNKAGVVGPAVGTKPRQVLMDMEQFDAYLTGGGEQGEALSEEELALAEEFQS
jgi:S-DNA-T family DNA segregation ATPase FtsK/SpoIIIE